MDSVKTGGREVRGIFKTPTMDNKHLPAYPQPIANNQSSQIYACSQLDDAFAGLSKLEMVSAMCLQGLLASGLYAEQPIPQVAETAIIYAENLLTHISNTEK